MSSRPSSSSETPPVRPSPRAVAQTRIRGTRSLLQALTTQIRTKTLPWVRDLTRPIASELFLGPPPPLTNVVDQLELAGPDSRFADVDGVRVHYTDYGAEGATKGTVVLLHGFNGSTFSFRLVSPGLAALGYRVIAIDRPPFGLTERPLSWPEGSPNPYTNVGAARMTWRLMDILAVDEFSVMGHSAGAPVALEVLRQVPSRVATIGLISPALPSEEGRSFISRADIGQQLRFLLVRIILSRDAAGLYYVRNQIEKRTRELKGSKPDIGLFDPELMTDELLEGYLKPSLAKDWDRGTLLQFRSFETFSTTLPFDEIRCPVVVIQGQHDTVTSTPEVRRLAARLAARPASTAQAAATATTISSPATPSEKSAGDTGPRGIGGRAGRRGRSSSAASGAADAADRPSPGQQPRPTAASLLEDLAAAIDGGSKPGYEPLLSLWRPKGPGSEGAGLPPIPAAPPLEYYQIARAGHLPMDEQAPAVVTAIDSFLSGLGAHSLGAAGPVAAVGPAAGVESDGGGSVAPVGAGFAEESEPEEGSMAGVTVKVGVEEGSAGESGQEGAEGKELN